MILPTSTSAEKGRVEEILLQLAAVAPYIQHELGAPISSQMSPILSGPMGAGSDKVVSAHSLAQGTSQGVAFHWGHSPWPIGSLHRASPAPWLSSREQKGWQENMTCSMFRQDGAKVIVPGQV